MVVDKHGRGVPQKGGPNRLTKTRKGIAPRQVQRAEANGGSGQTSAAITGRYKNEGPGKEDHPRWENKGKTKNPSNRGFQKRTRQDTTKTRGKR